MSQQSQVGTHATSISTSDGFTRIVYHSTEVVKFNSKKVVLDSGGYRTLTTKSRMNQAANQYGLPYKVYQKAGEWFVKTPGDEVVPFIDGIEISR